MRRNQRTDDLTYLRSFADDDVIRAVELMRLGVPETTIYRRCRPGGPWQLLAPGVVLLSTGVPTRRQRVRAALLHAGPDALLTGLDAARLHGLRRGTLPDAVHVLIPGERQVRSVRFVVVERTTRLPPAVEIDGFPLAPLERCVLDAARRLSGRAEIAALLTEPVQRRMVSREALEEELDTGTRKGTAVPREILRAVRAGVRSPAELDVRTWWLARPDLGEVLFNVVVLDEGGRFVGIADVLDPEIGLVAQVDSTEHHFMTPDQVIETERQHRAYRAAGLHVVGIRPNRVHLDPDGLHRDVVDARRTASALPAAPITWRPDLPTAG
jgi:hypothetical protein